ncbi:cation diffusion facilitator family transporter [Oscillochloris trichoides DG-6]|uniref:Cation diffusion facilitator family transporter n=1 Tax=Oscillochloris trichoides DG-6 TaxID=765420 RepID=E1IEW5_9CHLR|nr:cation diffusion facilitator family transporter [Oscillochloris trichoides]EFO80262.1 cation diffusion facilitator family transporter [Oscillochloris trichoides DG-6]
MSHHHHDHGHGHHHHHHAPTHFDRAFAIGVGLNLTFVVIEFGFGIVAGSLALLSDAWHNLSDVLGLLLAWGALALSRRLPTVRHTYGLRRSTILAALANAALLLIAIGGIAWEAVQRLVTPDDVPGMTLVIVAGIGIAINALTAWLFARGGQEDLNIRGAFLHMVADALISLGVVVAGLLIMFTGWAWIDPLVSLIIVVVIGWGTWGLARDSVDLALDGVPGSVDPVAVRNYLNTLPGVREVHDLHIWALSTTEPALTVHLVVEPQIAGDALLAQVRTHLHDTFGIEHVTIQLEVGDPNYPCQHCPEEVRLAHKIGI